MHKLSLTLCILLLSLYSFSQNNALVFNGSDQYVQVTFNTALNPTAFTVSVWVKVEGEPDTKRAIVTSQNTASDQGYSLYVNTNNKWEFWIGTSAGPMIVTSTFDAADGWTNISGTFGNGTMRLFINGLQVAQQTGLTLQPNSVNQLSIGAGGDAGTESFFEGLIDRLCIWNVELTELEIRDIMYGGITKDETLVAFYRMNNLYYVSGAGIWQLLDRSLAPNYTGKLINMTDIDQTPSSARYGPKLALKFDGMDDYVDFSSSAYILPAASNFTQEIWAYPTHSAEDGNYHFIFGCDETLPDEERPPVLALHGENVMAAYGDGTNYNTLETSGGITLDAWNHIAVVYNSKNCIIYINGIKIISKTLNNLRPYANPIKYLGRLGTSYFYGSLDEARLWSDSRSEIEIQQYNYFNIQDFPDDLERYWNMDMGAGQILPEFTSGNDGTMENFDEPPWVLATSYNAWLNVNDYDDGYWENPANWSRGTVPVDSDFVSITYTTADPQLVVSVDATVKSLFIDRDKGLLITSGHKLTTIESLIFRSPVTNLGTNILSGYFTPTRSVATYTDSGTTEYNGSVSQLIELPTFNNLIINNSSDEAINISLDTLQIKENFTVQQGTFTQNDEGTGNYIFVGNDFSSNTVTDLTVNMHIGVVGTLDLTGSNIVGNGSICAGGYNITQPYTVFGVIPTTEPCVAQSTWTGGTSTEWTLALNWAFGRVPIAGYDVVINPGVPNYPNINIPNAVCGNLYLNPGASMGVITNGNLSVNKSLIVNAPEAFILSSGTLDIAGNFNISGGPETTTLSSGTIVVGNDLNLSGLNLTLTDINLTVNNLNLKPGTVFNLNNTTGLVTGDANVESGSDLKLLDGSSLTVGGVSGEK